MTMPVPSIWAEVVRNVRRKGSKACRIHHFRGFGIIRVLLIAGMMASVAGCSGQSASGSGHDGYCTADDKDSVTVVVDFGDLGPVPKIGCAYGLAEHATGMDALVALGISVTEVTRTPQFICRIDGSPTADQVIPIPGDDKYKETCVNTPPTTAYWTYWSAAEGGQWTYSLTGYALHEVTFGGYEGYSFAHNVPATQAVPSVPPVHP